MDIIERIKQQYEGHQEPEIEEYREMFIATTPNGNAKTSIVYDGSLNMVCCTFGVEGLESSVLKAKAKIDRKLNIK